MSEPIRNRGTKGAKRNRKVQKPTHAICLDNVRDGKESGAKDKENGQ